MVSIFVNLGMEIPAFGCGRRKLTALKIGRKHVRVIRAGKRRAKVIPRALWEKLAARGEPVA